MALWPGSRPHPRPAPLGRRSWICRWMVRRSSTTPRFAGSISQRGMVLWRLQERRPPPAQWCFAHLIARDQSHPAAAPPTGSIASATGHLIDEKGVGAQPRPSLNQGFQEMRLPCPHCGTRDIQGVHLPRRCERPRRPYGAGEMSEAAMTRYVYERDNPAGRQREYWHHSAELPRMDRRHPRYQDASGSDRAGGRPNALVQN